MRNRSQDDSFLIQNQKNYYQTMKTNGVNGSFIRFLTAQPLRNEESAASPNYTASAIMYKKFKWQFSRYQALYSKSMHWALLGVLTKTEFTLSAKMIFSRKFLTSCLGSFTYYVINF